MSGNGQICVIIFSFLIIIFIFYLICCSSCQLCFMLWLNIYKLGCSLDFENYKYKVNLVLLGYYCSYNQFIIDRVIICNIGIEVYQYII